MIVLNQEYIQNNNLTEYQINQFKQDKKCINICLCISYFIILLFIFGQLYTFFNAQKIIETLPETKNNCLQLNNNPNISKAFDDYYFNTNHVFAAADYCKNWHSNTMECKLKYCESQNHNCYFDIIDDSDLCNEYFCNLESQDNVLDFQKKILDNRFNYDKLYHSIYKPDLKYDDFTNKLYEIKNNTNVTYNLFYLVFINIFLIIPILLGIICFYISSCHRKELKIVIC